MPVLQLKQDLLELGFRLVGTPTGEIDLATQMALREFQAYAKMLFLAQSSGTTGSETDRLRQIVNDRPYGGFIHGVADGETLDLIQHWKRNKFRCPVVIQAFNVKKVSGTEQLTLYKDNIWLHDEVKTTKPRMYARDFSGYYSQPPERLIPVGEYVPFSAFGGQRSVPPKHTQADSEILPLFLLGKPLEQLAPGSAERVTYQVLRAVSEVECLGFFDSLNAYDNAVVSLGICHWTLGIVAQNGTVERGELGAYLAYLAYADAAAYQKAFRNWGFETQHNWVRVPLPPNGQDLFNPSQRKYTTWLKQQKVDGSFELVEARAERANFFKTWHWFYRFQMAGRTIEGFRRGMWDMGRIRLRDLLATPFRNLSNLPKTKLTDGSLRPATLGEVYRAPLAVALLLRWHIRFPGNVVSGGVVGRQIEEAFRKANLTDLTTANWTNCTEQQLLCGIREQVAAKNNTDLTQTMNYIEGFPSWREPNNPRRYNLSPEIGRLGERRFREDAPANDPASYPFTLDETGLPPAPPAQVLFLENEAAIASAEAGIANLGLEPLAAAQETTLALTRKLILRALVGNNTIYTVESDGTTLFQSCNNVNRPPTETECLSVTKLVFFDGANKPLMMLPVLPGSVERLRVSSNKLETRGRLRHFLNQEEREFFSFSIDVNHRAGNIEFNRLSFDGFGTAQNILFDELNETETLEKFVNRNPGGFPASTFAAKIGLRGRGVISDRHQFIRRLFFVRNNSSSPEFAKYLLAVSVQATLQNGTHKLLSFDLEFSADKMPVTPPLSGLGQVPFTLLVQRQPYGEQWQNDFEIRQWILETQFPQQTALEYWNKFVAEPVNFSLRTISSGRPVSFIPKLETNTTRKTFWKAAFSVFDRVPQSRIEDEQFVLKRGGADFRNNEISVVGRSLSPDSENAGAADFQVNARFESLRTIQAAAPPLKCRFQLKAREPEKELQTLLETGFNFKAVQIQPPVQAVSTVEEDFEEQKVRMGALEINFLPVLQRNSSSGSEIPGLPDAPDLFFTATFPKKLSAGNFTPGSIINRQIKYRLAVPDIRPGGQDDIPGSEFVSDLGVSLDSDETYREKFRREPSLIIIPKEESGAPRSTIEKPPFYVTIQETITEESSQSIALRLHRIEEPSTASGQAPDLYVFDPQPLFFAKVEVGDFAAALNAAITNELGNWTNRADVGAGWELSAGATGFDLVLPPQGLGEAMHRRTEDDDIEPDSPIDFRFTPPTKARLQASYFRQRFVEAPWNLRRILGYPGQRAAGAGVDEIDFELLYGLRGKLKAAHLRLTEIGARLGFLPGQQPPRLFWAASEKQKSNYELARNLWSDLYQQLQSRLAVLELRDENVPGKLRLDEGSGLSFELRPENLREPVNPVEGDENRLAGSFAWAFESNNVYRQLRRNPRSTAAQLVAPFFSALGGWGNQKAVFGLTTIYSDVTMGRVQSINIERIGRIGVFRNRAKHVIVYERTVVPSRQFFLEQHPLVGNAVLRKVDEYIELIEEERRYPENGLDNLARGFVLGCRFAHGKPPRIRVNSRWGEDVGTIGWKVPLWVRGAAPADVYPKPVINLIMTGERAGEDIITEIDEPEKLYFYTSTEDTAGLDTDAWASVENVDFAVVPGNTAFDTFAEDALAESFSAPLAPPPPKLTSDNPNDFKPAFDDLPVHAGSGGFTFALAAPPKPINVVAERAEKAIGSFLRNVTVMRGIAVETINDINFLNFVKFRDGLSNVFAPLIADLPNDNIELERAKFDAIVTKAVGNVQKFKMLYGRISDFLKIGADADFEKSLRNETAGRIAAQFEIDRVLIKQEIIAAAREGIEEIKAEIRRVQAQFPVLDDRAKDELRRQFLTIFEGTDDAPGILTKSKQVRGTVGEVVLSINHARARVDETLSLLKQEISNTKCKICELPTNSTKPAEIRRIVAEIRSRINEIFAQVDFLVAESVRFWTGSQLYKFSENARAKWLEIEKLMRKLEFDVRIFTPQTQQQVIGKLEEISGKLVGFQGEIHERLKSWERLLIQDEFLGHPFFAALVKPIEDWQKTIDTVLRVADSWQAFNPEIDKQINSFLTLADDFFSASLVNAQKQIGALVGQLHRDFLPNLIELEKYFLDNQIGLFNERAVEKLIEDWGAKIPTSSELRREFEVLRTAMSKGLNDFINRSKISVTLPTGNLPRTSVNDTLQLLRSYGKTPRVPSLNFPLPESGYYFFDLENKIKELPRVRLTPALAEANKLLDAAGQEAKKLLNPIEIRLPTVDLAERLIPFDLQNFDWSKLIPNCGGLKLDALFPKLRAPGIATDRVKITQDFNPETQSGWLQIDLDVPFGDQPITVFSLAGVTLRLLKADFVAVARLEAAVGQPPRQNVRGRISGDWDLQVGGFPIALLANCSLIFEEGKGIRFDISPDRVRLQQILAFLAELLAKFGYSDKGFSVAITPTGIRSILDLPLPDVQSGSFGLANLRLGFTFGLEITDNFRISTGLSVGRKDAPFTITIFILGGAGWFTLNVAYTPQTREFTTEVSIGILAAASLAIALGPIKGGVYAYFGISVEYKASNRNPSSLTIGLLLMFVGEVSLLNIVTVSLSLALEAQYTRGGGLVGRGRVTYKIKIGWLFTIKVSATVQYTFGKKQSVGRELFATDFAEENALAEDSPLTYRQAAQNYLRMFAA